MYGRDRLGRLSWRFLQEEAGHGALSDLMSHAIDMAQFMCGPISRVVAVKETFIKQRPLPTPGAGTHYERGKAGDPTGAVTNEDYVGALVEFENGARGTLECDRSIVGPRELHGLRDSTGRRARSAGITRSSISCGCTFPRSSPMTGSSRSSAATRSRTRETSSRAAAIRSATKIIKLIEALAFLRSVAAGRPHDPGFTQALANASVAAAMVRSWSSGAWEDVVSLQIDGDQGT